MVFLLENTIIRIHFYLYPGVIGMFIPPKSHFINRREIITYQVKPDEEGLSIYQLLRHLRMSRGLIRNLRRNYRLRVNGQFPDFHRTTVSTGDKIELNLVFDEIPNFKPEPVELDIVYEDDNLLIINKPPGMLVHPTSEEKSGTLANGVLFHFQNQNINNTFRPLHRLDRNTSGLTMVAKNRYAHNYLTDQFNNNTITREYLAFVEGVIPHEKGIINEPIGRKEGSIIKRKIDQESGKPALTYYTVCQRYPETTKIKVRLETGRTHQIRVHFSYLGFPLLGDSLYGGDDTLINRQALHAYKTIFKLPFSHQEITLTARMSNDLINLQEILEGKRN